MAARLSSQQQQHSSTNLAVELVLLPVQLTLPDGPRSYGNTVTVCVIWPSA